jgi:anaerobic magnesium-protoporphyrin IX monomethyl ester cyclase
MKKKIMLVDACGRWLKKDKNQVEQVVLPLGLMSLASYLKEQFGNLIETQIYNSTVDFKDNAQIEELIRTENPDIVGIRGLTKHQKEFQEISRIARANSNALIIGGGPYVSSDPNRGLADSDIDLAVLGEGEMTLVEIVDRTINGRPLDNIRGTAVRNDGTIVEAEGRELIVNLDSLPFPSYDSIDLEKYSQFLSYGFNKRKQGVINTSRGCTFGCDFCHNIFGKRFRGRSAENIFQELGQLHERGVEDFYFVDDNFNLDRERALQLFGKISSSDLKDKVRLYFVNGLRGDLVDHEFIDKMVDAGTIWVSYAIESASPRLQREMGKNLDLEKVRDAIEYSASKGIIVNYWGVLGHPEETIEEAESTIKFMEDLPPSVIPLLFSMKAYPGSELHKKSGERPVGDLEESFHDYLGLMRQDRRYIGILRRWRNSVYSEDRLNSVTSTLQNNGYSEDEIRAAYSLLYNFPDTTTLDRLIGG